MRGCCVVVVAHHVQRVAARRALQPVDQRARRRPRHAAQFGHAVHVEHHQPVRRAAEPRIDLIDEAVRADGGIDHRLPADHRRQLRQPPGTLRVFQRALQRARGAVDLPRRVHREGVELVGVELRRDGLPARLVQHRQRHDGEDVDDFGQRRHRASARSPATPAARGRGGAACCPAAHPARTAAPACRRTNSRRRRRAGPAPRAPPRPWRRCAPRRSSPARSSPSSSTAACRGRAGAAP